jgi:hypothetical protein
MLDISDSHNAEALLGVEEGKMGKKTRKTSICT